MNLRAAFFFLCLSKSSALLSQHHAFSRTPTFRAASLDVPPLLIVPPIDTYLKVPSQSPDAASLEPGAVLRWAEGQPEASRDPFELVSQELKPFSDNIKELVEADQPVLSSAASHFFAQRHGKRFRPTIVMLMAKASAGTMDNTETEAYIKQAGLGQITEMIHVASLIHDDVLDDADTRRGGDVS